MNINEFFGLKVREKRIALNLSQEKLANMADIDRTYLPGIENGKRNVSLAVAEKIAHNDIEKDIQCLSNCSLCVTNHIYGVLIDITAMRIKYLIKEAANLLFPFFTELLQVADRLVCIHENEAR